MTLGEIKYHVMFQTNNDADDIGDYTPHIRFANVDFPRLGDDSDMPLTPEWTHRYLADWATWLIYRNGNPQKQQRGYAYRESFERMLAMVADEGGEAGMDEDGNPIQFKYFRNIPR